VGVQALHTVPDGRRAFIDSDVLGLDRRLKQGDPTLGWRGDETMWLVVNSEADEVEVWGLDIHGEPYVVSAIQPVNQSWQHELLKQVAEGDWQRGGQVVFAEIDKRQQARQRSAESTAEDQNAELDEKLAWALMQDAEGRSMYGTFFSDQEAT